MGKSTNQDLSLWTHLPDDVLRYEVFFHLSPTDLSAISNVTRRLRGLVIDKAFFRFYFDNKDVCNVYRHQLIVWMARLNKRVLYTDFIEKICSYDPYAQYTDHTDYLSTLYFAENGWFSPLRIKERKSSEHAQFNKTTWHDLRDLCIAIREKRWGLVSAAVHTIEAEFVPWMIKDDSYLGLLYTRILTVDEIRSIIHAPRKTIVCIVHASIAAYAVKEEYDKIKTLLSGLNRSQRRPYYRTIYHHITPFGIKQLGAALGRPKNIYKVGSRELFYELLESKDRYNLRYYHLILTPKEADDVITRLMTPEAPDEYKDYINTEDLNSTVYREAGAYSTWSTELLKRRDPSRTIYRQSDSTRLIINTQ